MARITKPNRVSSTCVEMVLSRGVSRHLAVLLADLVAQLVNVEDIKNFSHSSSRKYGPRGHRIKRWSGRRGPRSRVPSSRSNSLIVWPDAANAELWLGGLPNVLQEGEHALREQSGRACVGVGQASVGEQGAIARVKEQLSPIDGLVELAGGVEVSFLHPFVGLHHVDLQRNAPGPWSAELRGREGAVK